MEAAEAVEPLSEFGVFAVIKHAGWIGTELRSQSDELHSGYLYRVLLRGFPFLIHFTSTNSAPVLDESKGKDILK